MRPAAESTDGNELRERMTLPLLNLLRAGTCVPMVWDSGRQRFTLVRESSPLGAEVAIHGSQWLS